MRISDWSSDVGSSDLLCHEASQGADYLAEQQGLTIRSSRKLRRSGLRPRRLLHPPRRRPRPTRAPTAPARPTPPLPTQSPQSPGTLATHATPPRNAHRKTPHNPHPPRTTQTGRAHDTPPVTNTHLVCPQLIEKKNEKKTKRRLTN